MVTLLQVLKFFFMPCLFLLVFPFLASSSSLLVRHTAVQGQKTSSARVNYSKRELGSIGYKRPLFEHTTIIHNQQFANKHKVKSGIFYYAVKCVHAQTMKQSLFIRALKCELFLCAVVFTRISDVVWTIDSNSSILCVTDFLTLGLN